MENRYYQVQQVGYASDKPVKVNSISAEDAVVQVFEEPVLFLCKKPYFNTTMFYFDSLNGARTYSAILMIDEKE